MNNLHVLVPTTSDFGVEYAVGVLNSKLMNWFYHTLNPEMGEALAEVKKENVSRLPVILPTKKNSAQVETITRLVRRLTDEKKRIKIAKDEHSKSVALRSFDVAQKSLNDCVYGLYRLSRDEIDRIERDEAAVQR